MGFSGEKRLNTNAMKVRKKFTYKGFELRIVERQELYMNSGESITVTRVLAPNGGSIPILLTHKQTLKSIIAETITLLDRFEERGADIEHELTREL